MDEVRESLYRKPHDDDHQLFDCVLRVEEESLWKKDTYNFGKYMNIHGISNVLSLSLSLHLFCTIPSEIRQSYASLCDEKFHNTTLLLLLSSNSFVHDF